MRPPPVVNADVDISMLSNNIFEKEEMEKVTKDHVDRMASLALIPGMTWPTIDDCREFFKNLAIKNKFSFKPQKNDRTRYILKCIDAECKWGINATVIGNGYTFQLRKFCGEHTCQANEKDMYKQCITPWVANALEDEFRTHPTYRPEDIQAEIMSRHGVHISYWTA
ncbi:hypothetical protein IFM89_011727 [Coptis chinensis]|uniref:Transposase MuDR plant domain-containing protein n=1 Tax=Coptis chinensis TaxID=261450 RepID=A0A835IZT7_9MAGN|nr:hypothetical protein IFM89_011727 [Coptis chinensis]